MKIAILACLLAGTASAQTYDFNDGVVSGQITLLQPLVNGDNQLATDYENGPAAGGVYNYNGVTYGSTSWVFNSPALTVYPYGYPGAENQFSSAQAYITEVVNHGEAHSYMYGDFDFQVANNQIVAWNMQVGAGDGDEESDRQQFIVNMSSTGGDSWSDLVCSYYCYTLSGSEPSGTLTEVAQAPEINTASLPAALTLLLGGIAMSRGRRPRRD